MTSINQPHTAAAGNPAEGVGTGAAVFNGSSVRGRSGDSPLADERRHERIEQIVTDIERDGMHRVVNDCTCGHDDIDAVLRAIVWWTWGNRRKHITNRDAALIALKARAYECSRRQERAGSLEIDFDDVRCALDDADTLDDLQVQRVTQAMMVWKQAVDSATAPIWSFSTWVFRANVLDGLPTEPARPCAACGGTGMNVEDYK